MSTSSISSKRFVSQSTAIMLVMFLWASYALLQTLFVTGYISELWSTVLSFLPGAAGVAILMAAGWNKEQLFLQGTPPSRAGLLVLGAIFVIALAVVLPFGRWQGWNWLAALVYAPASGISQELFFRAALLPAFLTALRQRPGLALLLHSLLFGLWHIGPLFLGAPVWAVMAIMFVPFLCGLGWGWQVRRDRTVVWAMIQHSLIWVIGMQFPIPG